jgi:hypothetical protein
MNAYFASVPNCPVSSLKELLTKGTLHPGVARDLSDCAESEGPYGPEMIEKLENVIRNTQLVTRLYSEHRLDAVCYPHQQILVVKIGAQSQAKRNGIIASTLGFPAITVPGGFSTPMKMRPLVSPSD